MLTDTIAFAENVNVEVAETKLAFGCKSFANFALDSKLLRVPNEHVMQFWRWNMCFLAVLLYKNNRPRGPRGDPEPLRRERNIVKP